MILNNNFIVIIMISCQNLDWVYRVKIDIKSTDCWTEQSELLIATMATFFQSVWVSSFVSLSRLLWKVKMMILLCEWKMLVIFHISRRACYPLSNVDEVELKCRAIYLSISLTFRCIFHILSFIFITLTKIFICDLSFSFPNTLTYYFHRLWMSFVKTGGTRMAQWGPHARRQSFL